MTLGDRPIPLPLALVGDTPYSLAFNYPVRMAPWVVAALLLGAGGAEHWLREGLQRRWPSWPTAPLLASAVLSLALIAEARLPFPEYRRLHVEEVSVPEHCAIVPRDAAVLHLPYFAPGPHVYEFACMLCDRPAVNSSLAAPPPVRIPLPGEPESTRRLFLDQLAEAGVSHVLVHPAHYGTIRALEGHSEPSLGPTEAGYTGRDVEHWLSQLCGPPQQFPAEGVHAYRVPSAGSAP